MSSRKPSGIKVTALNVEAIAKAMTDAHLFLGILQVGESYSVPSPLGFIATPSGVHLLDNDGVFSPLPLSKMNYGVIPLYKRRNISGDEVGFSLELVPSYQLEVDDILVNKLPNSGKVPLEDFIRTFGRRLECNYNECANFFKKLMPAPKDYSTKTIPEMVEIYNTRLAKYAAEGKFDSFIPLNAESFKDHVPCEKYKAEQEMLIQLNEMLDFVEKTDGQGIMWKDFSKGPQG